MPSRAFVLTVSALVSLPACGASVEIEQGASSSSNPLPPVLEPPEPPPALPDPGVRLGQGLQPRCIRSALGTVDCWDTWLGDPDATSPVAIEGIDDAIAVVEGIEQRCVLHATGEVSCWGFSHYGQLGLAVPVGGSSDLPVLLPGVELTKIATGHHAICGVEPSGQAVCWGGAYEGPLGDPEVFMSQAPVDVVGVPDAIDIAASMSRACAVRAGGAVTCWETGELPLEVAGVEHASRVSVGSKQACAIVDQGSVVCWAGAGGPALVPGVDDAVQISASWERTCARRASGGVTCWFKTSSNEIEPAHVEAEDAIDVTALGGSAGGCLVRSSGEVECWQGESPPSPFP
jgi:hypothetical protein